MQRLLPHRHPREEHMYLHSYWQRRPENFGWDFGGRSPAGGVKTSRGQTHARPRDPFCRGPPTTGEHSRPFCFHAGGRRSWPRWPLRGGEGRIRASREFARNGQPSSTFSLPRGRRLWPSRLNWGRGKRWHSVKNRARGGQLPQASCRFWRSRRGTCALPERSSESCEHAVGARARGGQLPCRYCLSE